MDSNEIRKKFLDYFEKNGHTIVPSSSLIPDDPSVLLTTAGMQQFKPYFIGKADPIRDFGSKNTASVQKSFRTSDIDEVGDESHLTFFEMLGNFSFGGYFKKEAIQYGYDFIVKEMGLSIDYVSVFDPAEVPEGDWRKGVAFDKESYQIWQSEVGLPREKIRREGVDNFWGPTGAEGPCGPTTEIYVKSVGGQSIEIWNIVFNEFYCNPDKSLKKLSIPGVDTGMGLERLAMVSQNVPTIFQSDLFSESFGGWALFVDHALDRSNRIVMDHLRGVTFLLADGVRPSNKDAGYILRRLIRRSIVHGNRIRMNSDELEKILGNIINYYGIFYSELNKEKDNILNGFQEEENQFRHTLEKGLQRFNEVVLRKEPKGKYGKVGVAWDQEILYGNDAFDLYQSYGFPKELMEELCKEQGITFDEEGFSKALQHHQEISRAGQEKKFGGHGLLLHTGELKAANEEEVKIVTRLHTATHLLQAAMRKVLGQEVKQAGSDITAERTRFDFTFGRKVTPEEIKKVEEIVNEVIDAKYNVIMEEMAYEDAVKKGALGFFKEKYPERVTVYSVVDDKGEVFSRELCGGPHVKNTEEIGKVKIVKEEAVGAGVRRIRATVE